MTGLVLIVTMKGRPAPMPRGRTPKGRRSPVSLTGYARWYANALEARARAAVLNAGERRVRRAFNSNPLVVSILWQIPTPKRERWGTLHTLKPDTDNLAKLCLDCLERAGALGGNDCRVARGNWEKRWSEVGSVAIRVERADAAPPAVDLRRAESLSSPPAWLAG